MNAAATIEAPGFAEAVRDSQAVFRAVLDAMARPGRVHTLDIDLRPPASLDVATAAIALTLVDRDTTLFLDPTMAASAPWFAFHAGVAIIDDSAQADFVLASSFPDLAALATGSDEAPETSATLILQVATLGSGPAYRLFGPGLAVPAILRVAGLPSGFALAWQRNHALFPRGVDIILSAGRSLTALPRSVSVEDA